MDYLVMGIGEGVDHRAACFVLLDRVRVGVGEDDCATTARVVDILYPDGNFATDDLLHRERVHDLGTVVGQLGGLVGRDDGEQARGGHFARVGGEDAVNLLPDLELRRFEANREICLSISGHHEETWQPAWGIRTALVALRSFMETDARGQLGGLDTSDQIRRSLAAESRSWRCAVCAHSNEEILRECEERCKELEAENPGEGSSDGAGRGKEVEIPAELKMGFRDEMGKSEGKGKDGESAGAGADADASSKQDREGSDAETAQLAEGFVQTAPLAREAPPPPVPAPAPPSALSARPAQGVPAPTAITTPPRRVDPAGQVDTAGVRRVDPNAGVPPWIDYAIMSLLVLLVAMILKVFGGY